MNEQAMVTWRQALKLYWSNFWRAALVMFGGTVVIAPIYGFLIGLLLPEPSLTEIFLRLIAILAATAWVFGWAARSTLRLRYSDFFVKPSTAEATESESAITVWQGVRFWWAYAWRGLLIGVPFSVVVQYALHGSLVTMQASPWDQLIYFGLTWPVHIAAAAWAIRVALTLKYGTLTFQVQQLRSLPASDAAPPEPTAG